MGGILADGPGPHAGAPGAQEARGTRLSGLGGGQPSPFPGSDLPGYLLGPAWCLGLCARAKRSEGQPQMGSLAGAAHLLKHNAGVLRRAQ